MTKNGLKVCEECKSYIDYDAVNAAPPLPTPRTTLRAADNRSGSSDPAPSPTTMPLGSARSAANSDFQALGLSRYKIKIRTAESRNFRGVKTAANKASFRD